MSFFLFAALVLLLFVLLLIFWPLFTADKYRASHNAKDNVAIFKERLDELEQEQKQGYLDETAYRHLKLELEKGLLTDVEDSNEAAPQTVRQRRHWLLAGLLTTVLLMGGPLLYWQLGRSDDYLRYQVLREQAAESHKKLEDFKAMVAKLRSKLTESPEDYPKWSALAKSYVATGDFDQAVDAFRRMLRFMPKTHPDYAAINGLYAQSLYLAAGEKLTPAALAAAERALALDSEETSALTLKGIDAYDRQHFAQAIDYWQRAKIKANEAQMERFLVPAIASAQERLGTTSSPQQAAGSGASITVRLRLAPALKARVPGNLTVFVFAKAVGGRMPVAAVKLKAGELPATIVLDDSKAVMPAANLSSVDTVDITARISFSGQALARPGDLIGEAEAVPVTKRTQPVELVIADEVK